MEDKTSRTIPMKDIAPIVHLIKSSSSFRRKPNLWSELCKASNSFVLFHLVAIISFVLHLFPHKFGNFLQLSVCTSRSILFRNKTVTKWANVDVSSEEELLQFSSADLVHRLSFSNLTVSHLLAESVWHQIWSTNSVSNILQETSYNHGQVYGNFILYPPMIHFELQGHTAFIDSGGGSLHARRYYYYVKHQQNQSPVIIFYR